MTGKQWLLLSCAISGLCVAVPHGRVDAQAFNATPKTVAGGVDYDRATPGVETIFVSTPSAIINWIPATAGSFLPAGNVATFRNGPNNQNFAVLNRIFSDTPVRFDGTVLGRLQAMPGAPLTRGGTIVFQTPGGMIVGQTALFDVGSLVLTTLNVVDDGASNFGGQTGSYELAAVGGVAPASIVIEPGARIAALNQGSYVAIVAPSITQSGLVRVNGSIAYVAGEQVVLKVNNGLFDIIVSTGTDSVTGIVHTGTSGGPSSGAADDVHRLYMVAMPKNQALTAVLEGSVGFDPAVVASVENGAIVLSAGFNVVGGNVERFATLGPVPPGANASFHIRGGTLSSDLFGFAAVDMFASAQTTGALIALQDVSLTANGRARLFAGPNQSVEVFGNVLVSAAQPGLPVGGTVDLVGGEAMIFATGGGRVVVGGNATVDASAVGGTDLAVSLLGTGTGGNAALVGDGGLVRVDGNVLVLASGAGAKPSALPPQGTAGFGGAARVEALNGGTVVLGGSLGLDASGAGGASNGLAPAVGAVGTGGNVRLAASGGGSVTVAGGASLAAEGSGGAVLGGPGNVGGVGQGGAILVAANRGTINLAGTTAMTAGGNGGAGPRGGDGRGGSVSLDVVSGQLLFGGAAGFAALGRGGNAQTNGGDGGDGFGGEIVFTARAGGGGSRLAGGSIEVDASGLGGAGGNGSAGVAGGDGGDGRGGAVVLLAEAGNGTIEFDATSVTANGAGGGGGGIDNNVDGGSGGEGRGGEIEIGTSAVLAGGPGTGSVRLAQLDARASGLGGGGGLGAGGGGAAFGGGVTILAASAPVAIAGTVTLEADGLAGAGGGTPGGGGTGAGGQASGGRLRLDASGAGGTLTAPDLVGTASALGDATAANLPGEWHVTAGPGGTLTLVNLTLTADANGTPGTPAFSSLEPTGGTITVAQLATLMARGEIRIIGADAGRALGGRYVLTAGADLTASHTNPGGATVDVTDLAITTGGDFRGNPGSLLRATNRLDLTAAGAAFLDGGLLGREIRIGADSIAMQPSGRVGDAATELVEMTAVGNAQLAGIVLGRDILITASAIGVAAAGTVGGPGTDQATLRAAGTITVGGRVLGRSLLLGSSDIDIQTGGAIGDAGTELVTLEVSTPVLQGVAQPTVLGGTAPGTGYTLANAEAGRIRAGTLRVIAPGLGNAVAVLIRDLDLNGGGAAAGLGRFELVTPGIARIEGNVLMANARAGDGISLSAGQRLELVTPTASLRVRAAGGAPGGTLLIDSRNIWIATQPILDRLRADPPYPGRDDDLLNNGGVDAPRGFVEADAITLAAGNSLFVQNSGPAFSRDFAGITSGPGGLVIRAAGTTPATVTAFGRRLNADGSFTVGDEWFFLVDYEVGGPAGDGAGFSAESTFNTCIIVTGQCPARAPGDPVPGPDPTTGPTGGSDSILLPPGAEEDDLVDTSFSAEGLIEEPVTSGGESSLWEPDCERDEHGRCEGVEP